MPREEYAGKVIARMMGEEAPELASLGDVIADDADVDGAASRVLQKHRKAFEALAK